MVGTAHPLRSCLFHSWSQCGFSTALFSAAGTGTVDHRGRHTGLGTRVGGWAQDLAGVPGCDALGFGRRCQVVPCVPGARDICGMVRADAHLARHPEDSRPKTWGPGY